MGEVKRVDLAGADADWPDRLLFYRCLKAYDFAKLLIAGRRVLEIGCGTCYGLDHFDQAFSRYVGLDIDTALLAGLAGRYRASASAVSFVCADITRAPILPRSFDVVITFQIIEHMVDARDFLGGAAGLLRPGGLLLVTTPNRSVRLLPLQKPWNPEHVREYSLRGFRRLLRRAFDDFRLYGICGDDLTFELERRRVRQDAYQVYLRRPLGSLARRVLPDRMLGRLTRRHLLPGEDSPTGEARPAPADISLDNYRIGEPDARDCLDFLAVATI